MSTRYDTLPPADLDERLDYEGYHQREKRSYCRLRVYRPVAQHEGMLPVVVVLSDPDDPESGTSITNRVERAAYLAWERLGCPWPVTFVEHYPGKEVVPRVKGVGEEHWDRVTFSNTLGTPPATAPCWAGGIVVGPMFLGEPHWKRLSRAAFLALIGREEEEDEPT
jgi:hypothetical protein